MHRGTPTRKQIGPAPRARGRYGRARRHIAAASDAETAPVTNSHGPPHQARDQGQTPGKTPGGGYGRRLQTRMGAGHRHRSGKVRRRREGAATGREVAGRQRRRSVRGHGRRVHRPRQRRDSVRGPDATHARRGDPPQPLVQRVPGCVLHPTVPKTAVQPAGHSERQDIRTSAAAHQGQTPGRMRRGGQRQGGVQEQPARAAARAAPPGRTRRPAGGPNLAARLPPRRRAKGGQDMGQPARRPGRGSDGPRRGGGPIAPPAPPEPPQRRGHASWCKRGRERPPQHPGGMGRTHRLPRPRAGLKAGAEQEAHAEALGEHPDEGHGRGHAPHASGRAGGRAGCAVARAARAGGARPQRRENGRRQPHRRRRDGLPRRMVRNGPRHREGEGGLREGPNPRPPRSRTSRRRSILGTNARSIPRGAQPSLDGPSGARAAMDRSVAARGGSPGSRAVEQAAGRHSGTDHRPAPGGPEDRADAPGADADEGRRRGRAGSVAQTARRTQRSTQRCDEPGCPWKMGRRGGEVRSRQRANAPAHGSANALPPRRANAPARPSADAPERRRRTTLPRSRAALPTHTHRPQARARGRKRDNERQQPGAGKPRPAVRAGLDAH